MPRPGEAEAFMDGAGGGWGLGLLLPRPACCRRECCGEISLTYWTKSTGRPTIIANPRGLRGQPSPNPRATPHPYFYFSLSGKRCLTRSAARSYVSAIRSRTRLVTFSVVCCAFARDLAARSRKYCKSETGWLGMLYARRLPGPGRSPGSRASYGASFQQASCCLAPKPCRRVPTSGPATVARGAGLACRPAPGLFLMRRCAMLSTPHNGRGNVR